MPKRRWEFGKERVMASNVTFTRLARADLSDLVEAAGDDDPQAYVSFLAANSSSVADYDWDGEAFGVLLPVLADDYDIDLEAGENEIVADISEAVEATVIILTADEKEKYLDKLSPDNFSEEELREAYEDFTEEEEDAIAALFQSLQEVDADHVVVVTVG
jgi:hypothetical protein